MVEGHSAQYSQRPDVDQRDRVLPVSNKQVLACDGEGVKGRQSLTSTDNERGALLRSPALRGKRSAAAPFGLHTTLMFSPLEGILPVNILALLLPARRSHSLMALSTEEADMDARRVRDVGSHPTWSTPSE